MDTVTDMIRRRWLIAFLAGSILLLVACEPSEYGDNTQTQVAVYLTQVVPTIQAGGTFVTPQPDALPIDGASDTGTVGGAPTQPPRAATEEDARVSRVIDGDTLELEDGRSVRLIGINTPESNQLFYDQATNFTAGLAQGQIVSLAYDIQRTDQFGRTLAYVYIGEIFLNLEIVRAGYASAFPVDPDLAFQQAFDDAERDARSDGRGIWIPSSVPLNITALNPDAEGDDNLNPNGEWIEITNEGAQVVELTGFTLSDQANHLFIFPQMVLLPTAKVRILSGVGFNTVDTLYWGVSDDAVWNNDGDSAFLRDTTGALIDVFSY